MIEVKRRAAFERFVNRTETCWLWTGAKNPAGYGQFRVGEIRTSAHRWAWQWANGPIPEGMEIHHICHTPPCVNPAHLTAMTRRRNLQRREFDAWRVIDARDGPAATVTIELSEEHSSWLRGRSIESGLSYDEIVARAMYSYRHMLKRVESASLKRSLNKAS